MLLVADPSLVRVILLVAALPSPDAVFEVWTLLIEVFCVFKLWFAFVGKLEVGGFASEA